MIRFQGKNAWYMYLIVAAVLALPLLPLLWDSLVSIWLWLALGELAVALLFLPMLIRNRVDVYDERVEICSGFMTCRIPFWSITRVERTRSVLAGTANSLDRVHLAIHGEDGYDDAIVALRDSDAFIAEIRPRCAAAREARRTSAAGVDADTAWR